MLNIIDKRTRAGRLATLVVAALALVSVPASAQLSPLADAAEVALGDLHRHSKAIFVGTVSAVDESAVLRVNGNDPTEALTSVTFTVDEAITGAFAGNQVEVVFRGGNRRDGLVESWSPVPDFAVGDTYLVSLKNEDYTVTPLTPSFAGVLRFETANGASILVDSDGHSVTVNADGKLTRVKRIASNMRARRQKQRVEQAQSASVDVSDYPAEFPTPADADVASVDSASTVIAKLKQAVRASGARSGAQAISRLTPKPLDNALPRAN